MYLSWCRLDDVVHYDFCAVEKQIGHKELHAASTSSHLSFNRDTSRYDDGTK